MPRILITGFCTLPGPNRAGVQMRHIVRALARRHSVDVLVVRHGEQAYVERQGNARILRVPITEEGLRAQVEAFRRALRRQLDGADYDIVHFRDGWTGAAIMEMRERLEYATVFDATRAPIAEPRMMDLELGAEISQYEEACLADADLVLVPHKAAHKYVVQSHGRAERVFIVPPGVDVDQFDWDDLPEGKPKVLYCGSIAPGRGVRVLLRAMVYVNQQTEASLILAGHIAPKFQGALQHAISELGLDGRVEMVGELEHYDIPGLIASATVCVAPVAAESRSQPMALFPTKLLEYMACQRPVVAPLRGTAANLIKDGTHGLLFNPADPAHLSLKILKLLGDEDASRRMATAGYRLVRRAHTAAATRRGLRKAYGYLIELAPWGEKISDILDDPSQPSRFRPEDISDSISDNTDEYEPPFSERLLSGAGDVTTVDPRLRTAMDTGDWDTTNADLPATDLPTQEQVVTDEMADDWIVAGRPGERGKSSPLWRQGALGDEDGTPLDVRPAPPAEDIIENRFVAGEVEVADSPPDLAIELEKNSSFTAASVLLSNLNDDTDGAGRDEPG